MKANQEWLRHRSAFTLMSLKEQGIRTAIRQYGGLIFNRLTQSHSTNSHVCISNAEFNQEQSSPQTPGTTDPMGVSFDMNCFSKHKAITIHIRAILFCSLGPKQKSHITSKSLYYFMEYKNETVLVLVNLRLFLKPAGCEFPNIQSISSTPQP